MNMARIHTSPPAPSEPKSAATRMRRSCENYMFKKIFRATNIYESVLPVWILTTVAGLTPYYFIFSARVTKVKISYIRLIWSLFIVSVICVCSTILRESKGTLTVVLFGDSFIHAIGDRFQLIASIATAFINITLSIYRRKNIVNILEAFMKVDEMFKTLGIVTTYHTVQALLFLFVIFHFFATAFAIAGLVFTVRQGDSLPDYSFILTCFISLYITVAVVFLFSVYILLLTRRFQRLNGALERTEMTISGSSLKILSLRRIHSSLCDIADLINRCFNIQILIIIGITFITTVFHFFYILEGIGGSNRDDEVLFFMLYCFGLCFIQFSNFLIISLTCTRCKFKALDTAAVVHKLLNVDKIDEDVKEKLMQFSMQLNHRIPQFSAFGLFPLDNTLLFTIIGSLTTYLIILTQFATAPVTPPLDL